MPLPMIHLQVAVNLFDPKEVPDSFLLGSIAPDSIHMRKNTTREDKRITHLDIESQGDKMEFAAKEYDRLIHHHEDESWKGLVRGYFAHLLTDYFWLHRVYRPFKESALQDGLEPDEIRKAYYKDTDQIDYHYYRNKPWKDRVWDQLIRTPSRDVEPYLTAGEIHYLRLRTIHWFDLIGKEPGVTPRYITQPIVDAFCRDVVKDVNQRMQLWDSSIRTLKEA